MRTALHGGLVQAVCPVVMASVWGCPLSSPCPSRHVADDGSQGCSRAGLCVVTHWLPRERQHPRGRPGNPDNDGSSSWTGSFSGGMLNERWARY